MEGKPFNITLIQVYAPISNAEEIEVEWFYEDPQDLLELIPKKDVLFIIREKEMAPHSSTLAWKIPWMEEPGWLPSMGLHSLINNYLFINIWLLQSQRSEKFINQRSSYL